MNFYSNFVNQNNFIFFLNSFSLNIDENKTNECMYIRILVHQILFIELRNFEGTN